MGGKKPRNEKGKAGSGFDGVSPHRREARNQGRKRGKPGVVNNFGITFDPKSVDRGTD